MKIKYLAAVLISLAGLSLTQRADAAPLEMSWSTNSPYLVGTVVPGVQGQFGGQAERDAYMTNNLLAMAAPSQGFNLQDGSFYSRTNMPPGPAATVTGAVTATGFVDGNTAIDVNLGTGFQYLVVAYDGPQGSVAVFNVGGLTGTIQVYRYAKALANGDLVGSNTAGQGFKLITGWTLLNPTGAVPDGGTTAMLLGAAFGALTMTRRFLKI
jgi:VPDSG-CTERM motif